MTVSYALRGNRENVSQQTIDRIRAIADEMGYDPSQQHIARRFRLGQYDRSIINHVVAVYLPVVSFQSPYHARIFQGVFDFLLTHQYGVLLNYATDSSVLPYPLKRGDFDGIISLMHNRYLQPVLNRLQENAFFNMLPRVSLLYPIPGSSVILTEDRAGAYASAKHLLELGHRYLVHFLSALSDDYIGLERLAGYQQACIDYGLDPDIHLRYLNINVSEVYHAIKDIQKFLQEQPQFTALLLPQDHFAQQLCQGFQRIGIRIPEDISVIGFDDTFVVYDEYGRNILSTVHLPLEEIGTRGAELLIDRITGAQTEDTTIVFPTELVLRASTAPPPTSAKQ